MSASANARLNGHASEATACVDAGRVIRTSDAARSADAGCATGCTREGRVDEMERAKKPTERHFAVLGKQLGANDYLVADRFTLAEVCYIPFLHFVDLLDVEIPDNVRRWSKALAQRPSVIATVPPM